MSGLRKAKKYDWKDSNMALFGSDTEKKVKKDSAKTEKAWRGAGQKVGIQIWRIVKFEVKHWPQEEYGQFFNGDSYIILNTYKTPGEDELKYDVHFWIGKYSTQDEYGTAAYKTVELDTLLDDKPVQHREVAGRESKLFKSYFNELVLLKGGAETGFRRVMPKEYNPRLLHFKGERKSVVMREIPAKVGNLNNEDVFILDLGQTLYQFNGEKCNKDEKFKATQFINKLKSDRGGKSSIEALDEHDTPKSHPFFESLKGGKSKEASPPAPGERKMLRISDESGNVKMDEVASGSDVNASLLNDDDVFVYDSGEHCYVYVGRGASVDERRNAMSYAHRYLQNSEDPLKPITVLKQGDAIPGL